MRILWHSNAPWTPSGYGQQTAVWVPRLAGLGHDVMISAPFNFTGSPLRWNGFTVLPGGLDPVGNDVLDGHYRLHRADLLITLCDLHAMDGAVLRGLNVAHWMPIDCAPLGAGDRTTLGTSGGVAIAISRFGERQLRAAGVEARYVPHGIDTALFRPPDDRAALREQMGIPADTFVIGMNAVNTESGRKAFPEQLAAFAEFHERHEKTRLMAHTLTNPPGAHDLAAIAATLGIADAVMFPDQHAYKSGLISGGMLANWYGALDLLSCCSYAEGFGLPIIEAQACGVPVVVTDAASMTELHGSGWTVGGERHWSQGHDAWWVKPSVGQIRDAYEAAYAEWPANEGRRAAAREFALQFDADRVLKDYWEPVLGELERRFAPVVGEPGRVGG